MRWPGQRWTARAAALDALRSGFLHSGFLYSGLLCFGLLGLGCEPSAPVGDATTPQDATPLLLEARDAALATRSASHDFLFGSLDPETAVVHGTTKLLARSSAADSLIRVEGFDRLGDGEHEFVYSTDGETVWSLHGSDRVLQRTSAGPHARGLAATAIYGYLPEFLETAPYWKELGSSTSRTVIGEREVGGILCDSVEVLYPEHDGVVPRHVWHFGRQDRLPRGLEWTDATTGPEGLNLWLLDLDVSPLEVADFRGFDVDAAEIVDVESPPLDVERWSATDNAGETVRSEDFRGRVLVLDFWNIWCVICRAQQPAMARVAADYAEHPVSFLGANVFETGDAAAYWATLEHPYGFLRGADALADRYGVPWQPAAVVLGPQGETLLNLVGGSGDREEVVRRAIDEGLARL